MHEVPGIGDYLAKSKELWSWVADRLDGQRIPNLSRNRRLQLAMACQHLAIEHAQAIICLIDHQIYGSALALQRPMFEAIVRGVWLRYSATDNQVDRAAEGEFPPPDKMARISPGAKNRNDAPPLKELKDIWWAQMCGYTHGGTEQILARLDSSGIRANCRCNEVIAALRWSDMIQLYSGIEMVGAVLDDALAHEFLDRMKSYEKTSDT